MKSLHRIGIQLACIGLMGFFTGCATTQISSAWKDPEYTGTPHKIMVIGLAKKPAIRRMFESEFVTQLKARGVNAFASYTVLSDKLESNNSVIAAKMKEQGADVMLITRLTSKKTVQTIVPGTITTTPTYAPGTMHSMHTMHPRDGRWPDYYRSGYETLYTPSYIAEDEYAVAETNLYSAKDDKLIWSATSETEIGGSNQSLIKSYVQVMVDTMVEQKLLK